jgi:GntR family transcriptional regulator, transcriptional repressor for pyruvate dehydrogenase complex
MHSKSSPMRTVTRSKLAQSPEVRGFARRRERGDLVQGVVDLLEKQIVAGDLAADRPMPPEGELSRQLGVSRTVIREAMRILGARGLVEVSQGKLPRVKPADPAHVVDSLATFLQRAEHSLLNLTEVRLQLETAIAALAARRATADQLAAMEEMNRRLVGPGTLDQRIDADLRFHALLAEATQNPVFGVLLEPLAHLMRLSRKATLSRTGADRAVDGHRAILEAIRRGDPEAARQAMLEHLTMAERDLSGETPDASTRPS